MPTDTKRPCLVCCRMVRADNMPEHIVSHRKNIPELMSEEARKYCCDNQLPLLYQRNDGKEFKFACCLICKKGKTSYSIGDDAPAFIKAHMKSECVKKFDTVRSLYGFEEEAAPRPAFPVAFEFAEKPTTSVMESCHKTFAFSKTEALLPMDDRLTLMCKKYNQLLQRVSIAQQQKQHEQKEEHSKTSMEETQREAEATRLRVQAERDYEMKKRESTFAITPVPASAPPCPPELPTENVVVFLPPDDISDSDSEESVKSEKVDNETVGLVRQLVAELVCLRDDMDWLDHAQKVVTLEESYNHGKAYVARRDGKYFHPHSAVLDLLQIYTHFMDKRCDLAAACNKAQVVADSIDA